MQAMILEKTAPVEHSPLVRREMADPQPGLREVRVKVRACAICRTDLHVIEGDLPTKKLPIVPGHQVVGTVDRLGPQCRRLRLGQRVGVAWLRMTCGHCGFCVAGRENLCEGSRFTGYHADGGYAKFTLVHEEFAYPLPGGLSDVETAPLLCAGIIGYRALRRASLPQGGRLAIYGFGSSAHVVLQMAADRGAEVFVISRGPSHRELAMRLGAVWAGARAEELPVKVDSAIIFAPAGDLVGPALCGLEKGGTLVLGGIYMTPIPTLQYEPHLYYERDVRSVTSNTREDGRQLLAEATAVPVRPHVTPYRLHEANRALMDLKSGRIDGTGVLVIE